MSFSNIFRGLFPQFVFQQLAQMVPGQPVCLEVFLRHLEGGNLFQQGPAQRPEIQVGPCRGTTQAATA